MSKRQTLFQMTTALRGALSLLSPHLNEIHADWKKKVDAIGVSEKEALRDYYPLLLEAQEKNLERGNFEAYEAELEGTGRFLERRGLSEAEAAAAITLYLESCLPYVLGATPEPKENVLAFTHMVAVAQYVALSGFASERVANWRKLQERERLNLSRDLHDDIGHHLLVLKLYLEMMATDLKRGDVLPLEAKLEEALALVSYAVECVRRLILDLGPALVAQFGFRRALGIYARQFTLQTGIEVQLEEAELPDTLPSNFETALYRVLQGALSNVIQHSRAKHVKVTFARAKNTDLVMTVRDDGIGFDIASTLPQKAFGLTAMRERVEMLGGKFHIESWSLTPGSRRHGTRIRVELPLDRVETQGRVKRPR